MRCFASVHHIKGTVPVEGMGIAVNQVAELERCFTVEDVVAFGHVIGDQNPLHRSWNPNEPPSDVSAALENNPLVQLNEDESSTKVLVHGMLVGSIFSSIFGTLIPGAVYLEQHLDFRRPVYADETVVGRITVEGIHKARRRQGFTLTCNTQVFREKKECVRGHAEVWLPNGTLKQ